MGLVRKTGSLKHIPHLVYPNAEIANKADPHCLKITKIVASCEFLISSDMAQNTVDKESKGAFDSCYISRGIVDFEWEKGETSPQSTSHMVGYVARSVVGFGMRL